MMIYPKKLTGFRIILQPKISVSRRLRQDSQHLVAFPITQRLEQVEVSEIRHSTIAFSLVPHQGVVLQLAAQNCRAALT